MSSNIIYPHGGLAVDITVPPGGSIIVYTKDVARVYQILSFLNYPDKRDLIETVINAQVTFGPYPDGAIIQINAGASEVLYQVNTTPVIIELKNFRIQEDAIVVELANETITAEMMLNGILIGDPGSPINLVLSTYDEMENDTNILKNESFEWSYININDSNAVTVISSIGHSIFGGGIIGAESSATFRTKSTREEVDHFDTFRIS